MLETAWDTLKLFSQFLTLEMAHVFAQRQSVIRNDRHLALFAWALPPNSNAGVHRPLSFIRYGSRLGWRIEAFQGEVPINQSEHGEDLLLRVPKNAKLHMVPSSPLKPSYRLSPQIDGGFRNAVAYANHAIHLLSCDPPNIVLASGPPFHVFVSAYYVAKWFGVPLVLDYRDEWTECPFDFVSAGKQDRFWERRCLAAADAVLFTTDSHLKHQLAKFPELSAKKAHLVPNGWEPDDFIDRDIQALNQQQETIKTFNLVHVGALSGHNPPDDFLNALAELFANEPLWRERIRVSFIGRRSPATASALESFPYQANIQIIDHVSKREASRRMQEADVLLLLAGPELERYLPGKLFDYVASGQPILIFGYPGESSMILESLGIGQLCPPSAGALLGQKLTWLLNANPSIDGNIVQAWLNHHRRDELAKQAFEIFASLVK